VDLLAVALGDALGDALGEELGEELGDRRVAAGGERAWIWDV
jgi:hypothetical protein